MAQVQSPNNNGPNATTKVTIQPPDFIANDTRSVQDRVLDQQWRDVLRLNLGASQPASINKNSTYNKG